MKRMKMVEMQSESHSDPSHSCPKPRSDAAQWALFLIACSCGRTFPVGRPGGASKGSPPSIHVHVRFDLCSLETIFYGR
jgi:hypothetical protein